MVSLVQLQQPEKAKENIRNRKSDISLQVHGIFCVQRKGKYFKFSLSSTSFEAKQNFTIFGDNLRLEKP